MYSPSSASPLLLSPRLWYALEVLGPLGGTELDGSGWQAATPIFMTDVEPLKTGKRLIRLRFIRLLALPSPQPMEIVGRVVHATPDVLVLDTELWGTERATIAISRIDFEWLHRCCSRLMQRYPPLLQSMISNARAYLGEQFGASEEALTTRPGSDWMVRLKHLPVEHAIMPFQQVYEGTDAWLILRPNDPAEMEQKWAIHAELGGGGGVLRFHRTWTRTLIFEAYFQLTATGLAFNSASVNLDARDWSYPSPTAAVQQLRALIAGHLLMSNEWPHWPEQENAAHVRAEWMALLQRDGQLAPTWLLLAFLQSDEPAQPIDTPEGWTNYGVDDASIGPRLSMYPLHTQEWRTAFLERLIDVGEEPLLEAVAHMWSLLEPPREQRCMLMAMAAEVSGTGRLALWNILSHFMEEYVRTDLMEAPSQGEFDTLTEWHAAYQQAWANEAERQQRVIQQFAAILGGEGEIVTMRAVLGIVIEGPWTKTMEASAPKPR